MIGIIKAAATGANPAGALFALLWKPVGALLLVLLFWWWAHHAGYQSGFKKGAADLAVVQEQLARARDATLLAVNANKSLADSEAALRVENAELAAMNESLATAGFDALQRESARAAAAEKAAKDWKARYQAESAKAPCAAAKAELARACAALKDY